MCGLVGFMIFLLFPLTGHEIPPFVVFIFIVTTGFGFITFVSFCRGAMTYKKFREYREHSSLLHNRLKHMVAKEYPSVMAKSYQEEILVSRFRFIFDYWYSIRITEEESSEDTNTREHVNFLTIRSYYVNASNMSISKFVDVQGLTIDENGESVLKLMDPAPKKRFLARRTKLPLDLRDTQLEELKFLYKTITSRRFETVS